MSQQFWPCISRFYQGKEGHIDGHDYLWLRIICDYHNFDQFGLSVMFLNSYKIQFVLSVTIGNVMITDNTKVCRIISYYIRLNILLFLKRTSWEILNIMPIFQVIWLNFYCKLIWADKKSWWNIIIAQIP